jgi:ribonuclease HII
METELTGGLDEVGYGAWAGPIISVVAVFDGKTRGLLPSGVTDSKKVTEKRRAAAFPLLIRACKDVGVGHAWPWEIDHMGVPWALQVSYERALNELSHYPTKLIVDGTNRVKVFSGEQVVEPKADLNHLEVSVASMIAKHMRDQMMIDYAKKWPQYHWEGNKGYGSHDHEEAIKMYGLVIDMGDKTNYLHRRLYCRKVLIRGA